MSNGADRDAARSRAAGPGVLVVDDDESMRLYLARVLTKGMRARPTLAGTCEQALRLANAAAYDVVLLDLLMPGIGGFEVLKQVRRSPANASTPIIIVSVLSDAATKERCRAAGADDYLVKPVDRDALIAAVKAQIAGRSGRRTGK